MNRPKNRNHQFVDRWLDSRKKEQAHDLVYSLQAIAEGAHFSPTERFEKNLAIQDLLLRNSTHLRSANFKSISSEDLGAMFRAIDESYFAGQLGAVCEAVSNRPLKFRLSTRMTSTGGTTTMRTSPTFSGSRNFEISIATTPLFETFRVAEQTIVGGLICRSRFEALQRIMEHEMIHLVEMLLWNRSSCARKQFQDLVWRIFGHTEAKHQMLSPKDVAWQRDGISVGDAVIFVSQGALIRGTVNRISKRATVLVPSPSNRGIRYNDGKYYQKYYVPLARLQRVA